MSALLYVIFYAVCTKGDEVQTENTYLTILEWISDAEAGVKPEEPSDENN